MTERLLIDDPLPLSRNHRTTHKPVHVSDTPFHLGIRHMVPGDERHFNWWLARWLWIYNTDRLVISP